MRNIYFKEIEILHNDAIVNKTLNYIKTNTTLLEKPFLRKWFRLDLNHFLENVSELNSAFDMYDLKPTRLGFYISDTHNRHDDKKIIHVDYDLHDARINIPILNTTGTYTEFYSNVTYEYQVDPILNVPYYLVTNSDFVFADSIEIIKPTVICIKQAHRVFVPEGKPLPRIMLSVSLDKDPSFLI